MRFDKRRYAEGYEKRLLKEGYPGKIIDVVEKELKDINSLIDVGAGTGFFSIPLAKKGYYITAIEPSTEMIRIFKKKISNSISSRISIFQEKWESWHGSSTDGLICIHSIYPMMNIREAILKMLKHSSRRILLVNKRSCSKTLTEIIRNHFNKRKYSSDFSDRIGEILEKERIPFTIKAVMQHRESRFKDIDNESRYYCHHLELDKSDRIEVRNILKDFTQKKSGYYTYMSVYHDNLFVF